MTIENAIRVSNENEIDKSESNAINQDWPNLSFYEQDNFKLKSKSKKDRVVFMGDSITEGWSQLDPVFFSKPNYVNRGIGGQTTPQMLIRFKPDVIDLNPDIVGLQESYGIGLDVASSLDYCYYGSEDGSTAFLSKYEIPPFKEFRHVSKSLC